MSSRAASELQDALRLGLSVVSESWNYKAKNWITSIAAADIDNDGDIEIVATSRDGRVRALTMRGDPRWERITGTKAWVGCVAAVTPGSARNPCILTGTRDGRVYALDKDGKTMSKDGKLFGFQRDGNAIEKEKDLAALWHHSEHVIRQIFIDATGTGTIVIGSEDRCVYALDYQTGAQCWKFATDGWVRAVFACDINGDGAIETLAGSGDKHLYVLDSHGQCISKHYIGHQIHTIFARDIDGDGQVEIVVGTDGKDLIALTPQLTEKWRHIFDNRLLSLDVADIDNDGHYEILAGSEDKHLYILDQQGLVIWRHYLGHRIFSVCASDFDNDGMTEILVGADDSRVRALRVRLIRELDRKIRLCHQALGKPAPTSIKLLSSAECVLLQDILHEDTKQHAALKQITLKHINGLMANAQYKQALAAQLKLEQQKVEVLWSKDTIGYVRTLHFGDIEGDPKREIIIGTAEGDVHTFNATGRSHWSLKLGGQILAIQAGYVDQSKWQEVLACSTDHHMYVVNGAKRQVKRAHYINDWMSCVYLTAPNRQSPAEIIVGSEDKKIAIYKSNLQTPITTITPPQGIKIICAHEPNNEQIPEIVAGSIEDEVYAYTRKGKLLWKYPASNRISAISIKDIDGDDAAEIIIGSEDNNIHVLDCQGRLRWRYYTPHRVLSIDAFDIDHDGKVEVIVGCGDSYMYVFSRDGDLLWKYQANDRIRVVRAEDIDDDKHVEIAVGSEDQLELLRVVNQQHIRHLINECWNVLQEAQSPQAALHELLQDHDAALRAFALSKYAEQSVLTQKDFAVFEEFMKDGALEVRKTLIRVVMNRYTSNPPYARQILNQLAMDPEQDIRVTFVTQLHLLMQHDWELGFEYLERFSRNLDRFVRRAVVRKLHYLIDIPHDNSRDRIFNLLLMSAQDGESEWIRQEAARTLAHFLDSYHGDLMIHLYQAIATGIKPDVLQQVAYNAATPVVQHIFTAMVPLIKGLNESNVLERMEQVVNALEEVKALSLGNDSWTLYSELCGLLKLHSINEIARYQCVLHPNHFTPGNEHFPTILRIINRLDTITRMLSIYLKRNSINDRLASLLDAMSAIEEMHKFVAREYSTSMLGASMQRLPDHRVFELLLKQWHSIVVAQLSELRGKVELRAELRTKLARLEEQVGVWLIVFNKGRSAANNVKVTLLHSDDFAVIGSNSFETEALLSQEEAQVEFIISPLASISVFKLVFEIVYEDASDGVESPIKMQLFDDRLELQAAQQEFRYIPNPYSTGTPTQDSKMFYGRDAEIAFLKDNLTRTSAKTVIVLYGQRRSGKTSLLLHLINTPLLTEHIAFLIDMQQESYKISLSKFLHKIAFRIFQGMQKKDIHIEKPTFADFEANPTFAFDLFLDDVESHLQGQKIILLLDEFEVLETQVNKGQLEPEIFEYLRSLMQHRQSINFLLSGTHKIEQLTKGYWSVFFNIALHHPLAKLGSQGAEDLIKKPVAEFLEYEADAVTKIRQLTGDQPYLIHLICRSLVDYCNDMRKSYVTINDVNLVLREVMQTGQFHFDWIWEQASADARIALAVVAEGGKDELRPLSLLEIEEMYRHYRLPYKHEQIQTALKMLMDIDVIECEYRNVREKRLDGMRYKIPVGLIRRWLRKEKPLELVAREALGTL